MSVSTTKEGERRSRFYVDGDRKVPGVTSVIDMIDKPFLPPWAARLAAELAVDEADFVAGLMRDSGRDAAVRFLRDAAKRYTRVRSEIGTQAHALFDRMLWGERIRSVHPDMVPYRDGFAEFLRVMNPAPVYTECVAWSNKFGYAGRFDAITRNGDGQLVINDWKTSARTHAKVALQLAAYARADFMILPDGARWPMPKLGGASVLHITPEGWEYIPVDISDGIFHVFLCLLDVFEWDRSLSKTVLGTPTATWKV